VGAAVGDAVAHAAEAEAGDVEAGVAEGEVVHGFSEHSRRVTAETQRSQRLKLVGFIFAESVGAPKDRRHIRDFSAFSASLR
jgi:hypothetical protein